MGIRHSSALVLACVLAIPAVARADVQHTVARGHTVEAIAARYRVTAKSIMEANKLKDARRLRPGDVLTIPGVTPPKKTAEDGKKDKRAKVGAKEKEKKPVTYAMKAKTPGVVHLKRIASTEEQDIRVAEKGGKLSPAAAKNFEKMLRSQAGLTHPIDGRLMTVLGAISNHFGSRKIEIVSGFRPHTPAQSTPHSNHNHGKAVDFRVLGVPNEAVRDFCRTLKNVGCGYYPHGGFVHVDVRSAPAFWIDYSKPGEPPRYNAPNLGADDGTSDVHAETHPPPPAPADETETEAPAQREAPTESPGSPD